MNSNPKIRNYLIFIFEVAGFLLKIFPCLYNCIEAFACIARSKYPGAYHFIPYILINSSIKFYYGLRNPVNKPGHHPCRLGLAGPERRGALAAARPAARAARRGRPATGHRRRGRAEPRGRDPGLVPRAARPEVLTIGFARRVPTYKRLTLMLHDPERLTRPADPPGAAGADRDRRQVAPGRRGRQAPHPEARRVRQAIPRCASASSSCRTTTSAWRRCSTRAATCG